MRKPGIVLFCVLSCVASACLAASSGAKAVKSSRVLDLSSLLQQRGLALAVKNPETGVVSYTHDGKFLKKDGYFYQNGNRLQGYTVPSSLTANGCELSDVAAPADVKVFAPTSHVEMRGLNLNSSDMVITLPFDPYNVSSFNYTLAGKFIDYSGQERQMNMFFVKRFTNEWNVYVMIDGQVLQQDVPSSLQFDVRGELVAATGFSDLAFGAQAFMISMTGTTQYGSMSTTSPIWTDGHQTTDAIEETVDRNGYISERYADGSSEMFSKIGVFQG